MTIVGQAFQPDSVGHCSDLYAGCFVRLESLTYGLAVSKMLHGFQRTISLATTHTAHN
jgi:hypothetical protein